MSKLRLKETPLEREERKAKEQRRAARKALKRGPELHFDYQNDSEERQWRLSEPTIYRTREDTGVAYDQASGSHAHESGVNEDGSTGATSSKRARRTNYDQIQKELEEARFRAKLFDAMDDDERLDSIEARFNSYRVPDRWNYDDSNSKEGRDNRDTKDPNYMDDEEYAEWIRRGMWERRHRQEIEEEKRREQERVKNKSQEKRQREELRKLEEESRRRQQENRTRVIRQAFEAYNAAWLALTLDTAPTNLRFRDIPWPMHPQPKSTDELSVDAISTFLFSSDHSPEKSRKQRIRDAIFLYHPDRFNKWVERIPNETERHMARETAGSIIRYLTSMSE